MKTIQEKILSLSEKYSKTLRLKMTGRITEMEADDNSHYLIYRVLGIATEEGKLIDEYQNMGRFLYKYAGSFLEEAAILCFEENFSCGESLKSITTFSTKSPLETDSCVPPIQTLLWGLESDSLIKLFKRISMCPVYPYSSGSFETTA